MTQLNLLEQASQGDAKAIATLMNRHLQPQGITAKVTFKDGYLQIILESEQVPEQQDLMAFIRQGITNLGAESIKKVKVYGRQADGDFIAWSENFQLIAENLPITPTFKRYATHPQQMSNRAKEVTQCRNILSTSAIMVLLFFMFSACQNQSSTSSQGCYDSASKAYIDSAIENQGNRPVSRSDINRAYDDLKEIHGACQ